MENSITIRPVTAHSEFEAIERLQRIVWGMTDDSALVPSHLLIAAAHNGGLVLGAFTPSGEMVGFVFGFLGSTDDERASWMGTRILHCSHMLGVLPEYRSHAIGYQLKLAQRAAVLSQHHQLVIWTFDPLLSTNAWLNIGRLGAICCRYLPDLYGEIREELNAGLPTDRFEVDWWIGSERVGRYSMSISPRPDAADWRMAGAEMLNRTKRREDGLLEPLEWEPHAGIPYLFVKIPHDFQSMRGQDHDLAMRWRVHTREVFQWAFNNDYTVGWVARETQSDGLHTYYVLTNKLWTNLLD